MIVVGVLAGLALVVIGVLVRIAFILGTRAIVLEQRGVIAGLRRAFELLRARLGRVLLVWLIQVALGIAAGVAIVIVAIPLILVGAVAVVGTGMASGPMAAGILVIPFGLLLLAVLLVLGGMIGTYLSTYWTLAFRRMELDPIPAVAWPPAPQPPGPQPPGPQPPTA